MIRCGLPRQSAAVPGGHDDLIISAKTCDNHDLDSALAGAFAQHAKIGPDDPLVWHRHAVEVLVLDAVRAAAIRRPADPHRSSAFTPGSSLPSIHSRKAPPAVETKVKSSATPAWFSAATVSPPPATETRLPSWVSAAAVRASATVAASNGGVSKAPSGPFQTT